MITFGLAGPQCCFDSLKCVVQATLFQVMSVGLLVCTCICVRISLVRVHCAHPQWSGPRLHSVLLRKGCVCVCTFVLVKLTVVQILGYPGTAHPESLSLRQLSANFELPGLKDSALKMLDRPWKHSKKGWSSPNPTPLIPILSKPNFGGRNKQQMHRSVASRTMASASRGVHLSCAGSVFFSSGCISPAPSVLQAAGAGEAQGFLPRQGSAALSRDFDHGQGDAWTSS